MKRKFKGVTLIEVIIAIIVMSLGLLGLLALLPVAIQYIWESSEETQAAIIADSVKHALTEAVKIAQWDATQQNWKVTLTHDLEYGGNKGTYTFYLPRLTDSGPDQIVNYAGQWKHHPGNANPVKSGSLFDPGNDTVFPLEKDGWLKATCGQIRSKNDPTEPTKYYAFSFDIRKVNTALTAPLPPLDQLDKKVKDYEVRVNILRILAGSTSGGTEPVIGTTGSYEIISSFGFKVAVP